MALFSRRERSGTNDAALTPPTPATPEAGEPDEATVPRAADDAGSGPWDVAEVSGRGERLDFGSLWVPPLYPVTLELGQVAAAAIVLPGATMRMQAFAAPKTSGIWDEIRADLAEQVRSSGGEASDLPGPFGREILATLKARGGANHVRFWGVDGPRWFVRAWIEGTKALDDHVIEQLTSVFGDVVVVRGSEARAPRELLELRPPGAGTGEAGEQSTLDPYRRGPEITEVR